MNSNQTMEKQYYALGDEVRLVVLHPAAYHAHRSFGQILLKESQAAYAHLPTGSLAGESNCLITACKNIASALQSQLGIFVADISTNTRDNGRILAQALNAVPNGMLFIEGYDGRCSDQLDEMIVELASLLKPGHRLILSGRIMPIHLIESESMKGKVALLPVDDARMFVDYANPDPNRTFLEVHAFGQGQVLVNGRPIEKWEGHLPRALFFFLVDRAMTTRDEIFKTFWPRLNTREATNVFHVTKRKVSEILGVNLTVYGSGFYRISPEIDLRYDVVNFQEAVQNAAIENEDKAYELYQVAIDIYREDFLSGMEAEWIERRRDEMRTTYSEALIGLARIMEKRGELEKALGLFLRATAPSPQREGLTRDIMRLYHTLGQRERALEVYERLEKLLNDKLGVSPDPLTIQLAADIRQ